MFLLSWAPKRGAFMAKGRHSRGCHRSLGDSCPKLFPLDPPLYTRGVQPFITEGPNAIKQIRPRAAPPFHTGCLVLVTGIKIHFVVLHLDRGLEVAHPCRILRAGPSRCGAQCKTYERGPSEQWYYDVMVLATTFLMKMFYQN